MLTAQQLAKFPGSGVSRSLTPQEKKYIIHFVVDWVRLNDTTLKDLDDKASPKEKKKALDDAVNWLLNNNPFPGSVDDHTAQQLAKFPASGVLGHSLLRRRNK
jgi:hypothetical protein